MKLSIIRVKTIKVNNIDWFSTFHSHFTITWIKPLHLIFMRLVIGYKLIAVCCGWCTQINCFYIFRLENASFDARTNKRKISSIIRRGTWMWFVKRRKKNTNRNTLCLSLYLRARTTKQFSIEFVMLCENGKIRISKRWHMLGDDDDVVQNTNWFSPWNISINCLSRVHFVNCSIEIVVCIWVEECLFVHMCTTNFCLKRNSIVVSHHAKNFPVSEINSKV